MHKNRDREYTKGEGKKKENVWIDVNQRSGHLHIITYKGQENLVEEIDKAYGPFGVNAIHVTKRPSMLGEETHININAALVKNMLPPHKYAVDQAEEARLKQIWLEGMEEILSELNTMIEKHGFTRVERKAGHEVQR